jgi:hypothetical protein
MGWLQSGLFGLSLIARPGVHPIPVSEPAGVQVIANCDDFVRVAGEVFTGRNGAWFAVGLDREYLSGDTFGPKALTIGGVDPAVYLAGHCGRR